MIAYVGDHRTGTGQFDFVHADFLTGDQDADAARARVYADVGVTWWFEQVTSSRITPSKLLTLIGRGPPTAERNRPY